MENIKNIKNWLFDCDGVLWIAYQPIPGALDLIKKLQSMGKRVFFTTNGNTLSRRELVLKFASIGLETTEDQIVCTGYVAARYLQTQGLSGKCYVIGCPGIGEELEKHGFSHTGIGPDPRVGTMDDWRQMKLDPEVKFVVVGQDFDLSYMKVMKAATYINNYGCQFIATNEDTVFPTNGLNVTLPGGGCVMAIVKAATGREPVVMGKPHPPYFDVLKQKYELDPADTVIVGDSLHTDMALAHNCGLRSIFVLSGFHGLDDLARLPETNRPDLVLGSVRDILPLLG